MKCNKWMIFPPQEPAERGQHAGGGGPGGDV